MVVIKAGSNLVPNQAEIGVTRANCIDSMQLDVSGVNDLALSGSSRYLAFPSL